MNRFVDSDLDFADLDTEVRKYSPDQPREPSGTSDGGQFAAGGGGGTAEPRVPKPRDVVYHVTDEDAARAILKGGLHAHGESSHTYGRPPSVYFTDSMASASQWASTLLGEDPDRPFQPRRYAVVEFRVPQGSKVISDTADRDAIGLPTGRLNAWRVERGVPPRGVIKVHIVDGGKVVSTVGKRAGSDEERVGFAVVLFDRARTAKNQKLHFRTEFQGLPVSVENQRGSYRHWHDPLTGRDGKTKMPHHYGYLRQTEGNDGDHVDCFLGPEPDAAHAYVVRQVHPETGEYDEDKVMLGFASEADAKAAYLAAYDDPRFFGGTVAMPMGEFRNRVQDADGGPVPAHGFKVRKYSPDQPRDDQGQWAESGGGNASLPEHARHIPGAVTRAVAERPGRSTHGHTTTNAFVIKPDGTSVPFNEWRSIPEGERHDLATVHSHSADSRTSEGPEDFQPLNSRDVKSFLQAPEVTVDVIIMADGRMEALEKTVSPQAYVKLGARTKKLDDALHLPYAERSAYYDAHKDDPGYEHYEQERGLLRDFAKKYKLAYYEGLRWKSSAVAKYSDDQPRADDGRWSSVPGARVYRPADNFAPFRSSVSDALAVVVGRTGFFVEDHAMPPGQEGKAASVDLLRFDALTGYRLNSPDSSETRRAMVAGVRWLREHGYTHLTAEPVNPGVRSLLDRLGATPDPDPTNVGRVWLPLASVRKGAEAYLAFGTGGVERREDDDGVYLTEKDMFGTAGEAGTLAPEQGVFRKPRRSRFVNKTYEEESAEILARSRTAPARGPHPFEPAEWTHRNGHPRCRLCGADEPAGGTCSGVGVEKFSPDQPRDDQGQWADSGSGAGAPGERATGGGGPAPRASRWVNARPRQASDISGVTPDAPLRTITAYHVTTRASADSILERGFDMSKVKPRWVNDKAVSLNPGQRTAERYFSPRDERGKPLPFDAGRHAILAVKVRGRFAPAESFHSVASDPERYRQAVIASGYDGATAGAVYVYNDRAILSVEEVAPLTSLKKYSDDQPRVPSGSSEGGQWSGGGGGSQALYIPREGERTIPLRDVADVRREVERLSEKFGFPKDRIEVAEEGREFDVADKHFNEAGHVDPRTNAITLRPAFFSHGEAARDGMFAHEVMHTRFNAALAAFRKQTQDAEDETTRLEHEAREASRRFGEPLDPDGVAEPNWRTVGPMDSAGYLRTRDEAGKSDISGKVPKDVREKYPVLAALEEYMVGPGRDKVEKEDGFTEYSRAWWKKWSTGTLNSGFWTPVHETLAEVARVYSTSTAATGGEPWETDKPSKFVRDFYNAVNSAAGKMGVQSKVPRAKSEGAGGEADYMFVDEHFRPVAARAAVMVKVVRDGRHAWGVRSPAAVAKDDGDTSSAPAFGARRYAVGELVDGEFVPDGERVSPYEALLLSEGPLYLSTDDLVEKYSDDPNAYDPGYAHDPYAESGAPGKTRKRETASGGFGDGDYDALVKVSKAGDAVAIDFDGTVTVDADGSENPKVRLLVEALRARGAEVVVFTARDADDVEAWLEDKGWPALRVTNVKEPGFKVILDDRAVHFDPEMLADRALSDPDLADELVGFRAWWEKSVGSDGPLYLTQKEFDPTLHPRSPAGAEDGGQFTDSGGTGAAATSEVARVLGFTPNPRDARAVGKLLEDRKVAVERVGALVPEVVGTETSSGGGYSEWDDVSEGDQDAAETAWKESMYQAEESFQRGQVVSGAAEGARDVLAEDGEWSRSKAEEILGKIGYAPTPETTETLSFTESTESEADVGTIGGLTYQVGARRPPGPTVVDLDGPGWLVPARLRNAALRDIRAWTDVPLYLSGADMVEKYSDDQPRDDLGRWAEAGGGGKLPARVARSVRAFEGKYRSALVEHAAAVAADGSVVLEKVGGKAGVDFTPSEMQKMAGRGAVFSHNHPAGDSFSLDDVILAKRLDLAEIRAVTRTAVFRMRPGQDGWPFDIAREYRNSNNAVRRDGLDKVAAGSLTVGQAEANHFDLVWRRVAKSMPGRLVYTREHAHA